MRNLATALLTLGTILGCLGGARLPEIDKLTVGAALILLLAGATLFRLAAKAERQRDLAAAGTDADDATLLALIDKLEALVERAPTLPLPTLVEELGAVETGLLEDVAASIPRRLATMGGARFAEVFGEYGGGERLVRRAWSAAADGHQPEALASLQEGTTRLRSAVDSLMRQAQPSAAAGNPTASPAL